MKFEVIDQPASRTAGSDDKPPKSRDKRKQKDLERKKEVPVVKLLNNAQAEDEAQDDFGELMINEEAEPEPSYQSGSEVDSSEGRDRTLSVPQIDDDDFEQSDIDSDYGVNGKQQQQQQRGEDEADFLTPAEKYLAPDDSEEEDFPTGPVNTIGNIPIEWYDDMPHIGYDLDGKKVFKPATKDELDRFLDKMDDPNYWSTFRDKANHKDATLTPEELEIIEKLQRHAAPDEDYDPFPEFPDFFTQDVMTQPLSGAPEPKRRFVPSKWEHQRIMKIVRGIRSGIIVPGRTKRNDQQQSLRPNYNLWDDQKDRERDPHPMHLPPPKFRLPDHSESINPPEEYLLTAEERAQWENTDPEDRRRNYLPQKYSNLRTVPGYQRFINERFSRCLDLYLCPRTLKRRQVDPETLMPDLPDPKELEPFPKRMAIVYRGHRGNVRAFSVDPTGQWLVSGGDDQSIRLWEVCSGRCLRVWQMSDVVMSIEWNPNHRIRTFACAVADKVFIINPFPCSSDGSGSSVVGDDKEIAAVAVDQLSVATDAMLRKPSTPTSVAADENKATDKSIIHWNVKEKDNDSGDDDDGIRIVIQHQFEVTLVTWHKKGDYFATLSPGAKQNSVQIHQLAKHQSQSPFSKNPTQPIQRLLFHPNKPFLLVASQQSIRIYNLMQQKLHKTLQPGFKWISSIDCHPQGDNVLVGAYDKKSCWIDMDLSVKPYKTLRYNDYAVRCVAYHRRQPLFATCSDDGRVNIFHGMVYQDLMQNPLIVPLKVLKAHEQQAGLGALHCQFHPFQPWVFSSGSDGTIKLFT